MIVTYVTITSGFADLDSNAVITSLNITEELLQSNATGGQNMQKFFYSLFIDIYGLYKPITKETYLMSNFIFTKFSDKIAGSYSMLLFKCANILHAFPPQLRFSLFCCIERA